ncbi:unnamed protein product [Effrenium voratum]|uniref:Uncharacterized protein n=1 Tax=Effrenium voratum TaxID=2562239 RepID=A0AA36N604_9DINO|nr:unnamed protein product [Effrenium voratum]
MGLCIDADGSGESAQAGDALANVFVSPLKEQGFTVLADPAQQVTMSCVSACVAAADAPFAYLIGKAPEDAVACDRAGRPADVPWVWLSSQADQVVASFNGSKLVPGYHYELCLASSSLSDEAGLAGLSGVAIFVSGLLAANAVHVEPPAGGATQIYRGARQMLAVVCTKTANCSTQSEVFLSAGAGSTTALTARAALTPDGEDWVAAIDAAGVPAGVYYDLSVDLHGTEGLPPGNTGLMIFVSSLAAAVQTIAAEQQQLLFSCAQGCSTSAQAILARDCGGLSALPGTAAAFFESDSSGWSTMIQASPLAPGYRYQMCVDYDGPATSLQIGPSGVVAYISGVTDVVPGFVPSGGEQELALFCGQDCGTSWARLARDCTSNLTEGTEWLPLVAGVNNSHSILKLPTQNLVAGAHYTLCTELHLQGFNETPDIGDSGWSVYVSPLESFEPEVLLPGQALRLNCSACNQSQGFLARNCGGAGKLAPSGSQSISDRVPGMLDLPGLTRLPISLEKKVAALRLGIAVLESAGVLQMAGQLLETDKPGGATGLPIVRRSNSGQERDHAKVAAAAQQWRAGVAALGENHARDQRKVARASARQYLLSMDSLEEIAWIERLKTLVKAAGNADREAAHKWLGEPESKFVLEKATAAARMRGCSIGARSEESEAVGSSAAASARIARAKARSARGRAQKDRKEKSKRSSSPADMLRPN